MKTRLDWVRRVFRNVGTLLFIVISLFMRVNVVEAGCFEYAFRGPVKCPCNESCNSLNPAENGGWGSEGTAYYNCRMFDFGTEDAAGNTVYELGCFTHDYRCDGSCGGGGGVCPAECRQGSSCGVGYSGASGCSGNGPGGGCKSNQVCCAANSCGGGGGGGTIQCTQPQDCPPGTVKSTTVVASACEPLCGNNAWGTGGSPGTAQSYTGCCDWEETGGGNCVWENCPTKNNPKKLCKVCDPVETWCKRETVTTYTCIPSCTTQNPSTPTLVSPADGANIGGQGVTLDWSAVASWGVACATNRIYQVFVDTVPDPTTIYSSNTESVTTDYFTGNIGETYYWKIRAHNGSVYTDSEVRSFTIVDNQITGTIYIDNTGTCSQGTPGNLGGALVLAVAVRMIVC